jgi:hypothetical protein
VLYLLIFGVTDKYCDAFSNKNAFIYVSCVLVGFDASVSNRFLCEIILQNIKRNLFSQKPFTSRDKSLTALLKDRRFTLVSSSRCIEVTERRSSPFGSHAYVQKRHFSLEFTLGLFHYLLGPGFRLTKAGKSPISGF